MAEQPPEDTGAAAEAPAEETKPKREAAKADIDQLRSIKDKEISELRGELTGLRAELEKLRTEREGDVVVGRVEALLAEIDMEEEGAAAKVAALTRSVANTLSRTEAARVAEANLARNETATRMALELVNEHGGDFETYRRELLKATAFEQMQLTKDRLDVTLMREGRKAKDETPSRQTVDNGSGQAAASVLLNEMKAIDVTTPEGMKQWEAKEAEFRRRKALARG
jgi:hypothetical protein